MSEKPDPTELPYHHSKIPEGVPEKVKFLDKLEKEFERDMLENPAYKEFFSKFQADTIEQFCKNYAAHKRHLLEFYDFQIKKLMVPKELEYREEAETVFELILQKKLFNLQLLWRAEKVSLPEIKLGIDFYFWEKNIHHCSFLEEVSPAEVSAMKQFLSDNNYSAYTRHWLCGWQDYDEIMEKDAEGDRDCMPEWYEFYDGRMGTGPLLLLPDIRGNKEDAYRKIYFDWARQQPADTTPAEPYVPSLPYLHGSRENYTEFMNLFENDYIKRAHLGYLKEYEPFPDPDYDADAVQMAIWTLEKADIPVYMQGGMIWHEAIVRCAQQYKNTIIAGELDAVYEDYLMKREMKISGSSENLKEEYEKDHLHKLIKEQILKARSLAGEPENLDF